MNTYRLQIVLTATLLCAMAGSLVLMPLNVLVSILGLKEVMGRKSGEVGSKGLLTLVILLAVVLLVITFFGLMLAYMDILFALM